MDTSDLEAMGRNGKALVKEKYLWENKARQTIELYSWLLGNMSQPKFIL